MSDWLKLHRKAIDSQVFSDPELWHVFCWCLMKANWRDGWFMGQQISPGSFATGRESAANELRITSSKWYRLIKKLETLQIISVKSNNRFSVITVEKWGQYQSKQEVANNQRTTDEQQMNNQRTTDEQPPNTIEEGKERKERKEGKEKPLSANRGLDSNSDYADEFEMFWEAYPKQRRTKKQEAYRKWKLALKRVDAVTLTKKAVEYANSDVGRSEFAVMPTVWLNGACWEDDPKAWQRNCQKTPVQKKLEKTAAVLMDWVNENG
jgi:hypothetical protein